jgi:hypothetical protein
MRIKIGVKRNVYSIFQKGKRTMYDTRLFCLVGDDDDQGWKHVRGWRVYGHLKKFQNPFKKLFFIL